MPYKAWMLLSCIISLLSYQAVAAKEHKQQNEPLFSCTFERTPTHIKLILDLHQDAKYLKGVTIYMNMRFTNLTLIRPNKRIHRLKKIPRNLKLQTGRTKFNFAIHDPTEAVELVISGYTDTEYVSCMSW